jgi:uncharacterized protein (TIGR03083 family)
MSEKENVPQQIQLIRQLSNELAAFLYQLPEGVWRQADQYASPCEKWTVADVVTHLVVVANDFTSSILRGRRGQATPPMGFRPMSADERTVELVRLRDSYYEDLFPEFNASCRTLNKLLLELKPEEYDMPVWLIAGESTVSTMIAVRALELALHGWDIKSPFDRSAPLNKSAIPLLKTWVPRWLGAGFQKGERLGSSVTFRFALDDSAGECYDVRVTGDAFTHAHASNADADVSLSLDTDGYILFCYGRLPLGRSVRRGRIVVEGDQELAATFGDWFKPL